VRGPKLSPTTKNVLVICSDEHNYRCVGAAGHAHVQTPNLDALAARGTRFERAWTPSPICVPARASLATGRWVHELRAWDSAQPYTGADRGWAHRVRDAGAHAVSIGKLHYRTTNDDYGFTESILAMHVADGIGWVQGLPRRDPLPYDEASELAADLAVGESAYTRYDQRITDAAVSWLHDRADDTQPWTCFVSLVAPHYPLAVPHEFVAPYLDLDLPPEISQQPITNPAVAAIADYFAYHQHFTPETTRLARQLYLGLCSWLDHNVGRILSALADSGATDETLVIYTSDHGEMYANRGLWCKSFMYEDSVRVPMIAAGPGIDPAAICSTPVNLVDVAATITSVVEAEPNQGGPGRSLVDLAATPDHNRLAFSEYHDGGSITASYAVQVGAFKYMHHVGYDSELYDLDADPDELVNLAQSTAHRGDVATCLDALHSIVDPEATNERAFRSQDQLLERYGGREGVKQAFRFNHTPAPD